jgi:acyl-homoserine-lactone acylase
MQKITILFLGMLSVCVGQPDSNHPFHRGLKLCDAESMASKVTIYRDKYGVPHIYGPTDASVVFGFAYAQAEDNFYHLEDNYIRGLGRAAEIYGKAAFMDDQAVHAMEIVKYSKMEYEGSSVGIKQLLDAFAEGLNFYLKKNPYVQPKLIRYFEPWFPIALLRFKYHKNEFLGYAGIGKKDLQSYFNTDTITEKKSGSNAWAIGPSKTVSGSSMILINPHVPFFGYGLYTEAHLHSDEGWNFSGVARLGLPFPYMGHNEVLGWGHTDNYFDIGDLYIETFDKPGDSLAYKYGDNYRHAIEWKDTLRIKEGAMVVDRVISFKKTHHGPILANDKGKPIAVRLPKYEEGGWFEQWYDMTKATSLQQFKKALRHEAISYMNITYADRDGNIFYIYNGIIPKRNENFNWTKPVDGSNPQTEWLGFYSVEELPQITNPLNGFVQNCNSNPFFAAPEFIRDSVKYPKGMIGPEINNARSRRSQEILKRKNKVSFTEWESLVLDTRVIVAQDELPILMKQWNALLLKDKKRAKDLFPLIAALGEWDKVSSVISVAMTLFSGCLVRKRKAGNNDYIQALQDTKSFLEKKWGTWRVPWGEINRIQRTHWSGAEPFDDNKPSLPVGGAGIGLIFSFYNQNEDFFETMPLNRKRMYGIAGNSFVSIVEFGKKIRARSVLFFGQSDNPQSKHYTDQMQLYSDGKFKPAWFTLREIEQNLESKYHPGSRI